MKITGMESLVLKRSMERDGPQSDLPWHMAWRRVLEQAQWEERARYQPPAQTPSASVPQDTPLVATEVTLPKVENVQIGSVHESAILRPESEVTLGSSLTRLNGFSASTTSADMTTVLNAGPGPTWSAALMRETALSTPEARAPVFALGEWAQWLPRTMHMNVQGQQVRASVRDDQLDETQAEQLFHKMRNQLQSWGLDLIELVVNGHPAQPESVNTSQHKERNHGS